MAEWRSGGVAEWRSGGKRHQTLKHGTAENDPNPKTRNGCQGMLHKFCTKTPSAWLIYPHDDNARD